MMRATRCNARAACLVFSLIGAASVAVAAGPRVAVWDPVGGTAEGPNRFRLLPERLDQAAAWLRAEGMTVDRMTTGGLADPSQCTTGRYDALLMPGDSFPKEGLSGILRFVDEGGVLLALDSQIPFLVRTERAANGAWKLSPSTPFQWQTDELMSRFGLRYLWKPAYHDGGMMHEITPLLRPHLPTNAPAETLRFKALGRWMVTAPDAALYPLIETRRLDGQSVVPALMIARRGKATGIFCTVGVFTEAADGQVDAPWRYGRETIVAMARLAKELRDGRVVLDVAHALRLPEEISLPEPLRTRDVRGCVDPEGLAPLARWGAFDGSSLELGALAVTGGVIEVATDAPAARVPRGLQPGGVIRLALPSSTRDAASRYLRVRGAYNRGGAGLQISAGGIVLWNEQFGYIDAQGESNFGQLAGGEPIEFNRVVFLPPGPAASVELRNPGAVPVYFDALQVEPHAQPGRTWVVGLHVFDNPPMAVPAAVTRSWPVIRAALRFDRVGAPDRADRWRAQDDLVGFYTNICPRVHAIIQNTPGWAAISEARLKEATAGHRARDVAPDAKKFAAMLGEFLQRHDRTIEAFELWNEPELKQFFWGTREESMALFAEIAPLIRRLRPDATIIGPGFAGHDMRGWLAAMEKVGVLRQLDWLAVHCYAGKTPAWDRVGFQYQGELYALGVEKPIYANEQGITWRNAWWYQPPPEFTPRIQGIYINTGLARLFAGGCEKAVVFMAFNPHDPTFDVFDPKGRPRPAYAAVEDYMALCRDGGRRLDVSLAAPDGSPLSGVYAAAAVHAGGSVTLVLNPAEVERLYPPAPPRDDSTEFDAREGWSSFQGKVAYTNGSAILTVAPGQGYMGFLAPVALDLDARPILEVVVPECEATWNLALKIGGSDIPVAVEQRSGTHRVDLRAVVGRAGPVEGEIIFRVRGRTVLDAVRFLPGAPGSNTGALTGAAPQAPVAVVVRFPFDAPHARVMLRNGATVLPGTATLHDGPPRWAELRAKLTGRTVVRVEPAPPAQLR